MNLKLTRLHHLKKDEKAGDRFKTGVSLHCHTQHSKEMLDFIPFYAEKIPIISTFWERERKRYVEKEKREINFETAYWSPPMTAPDVFRIETEHINSQGLDAIVSISDHDEIAGNFIVRETQKKEKAPISLEWTVPFEYGFFHLGVHNLPENRAVEIAKDLLDYTFAEKRNLKFAENRLTELFVMLNEIPEVLIIFNHPFWDIEMVGQEKHEILLDHFMAKHKHHVHALEINGFRTWSENKQTIELAEQTSIPLISGGDRHGCQPNVVLNLTNTTTFDEFVEQIRIDKHSEVAFAPEYAEPLHSRQLASFAEILNHYPDFPEGRQKWFERVFFDNDGKGVRPLTAYGWKLGGPKWLRAAIWTLGVLGSPRFRPFFQLAMKRQDEFPTEFKALPPFDDKSLPEGENVTPDFTSNVV